MLTPTERKVYDLLVTDIQSKEIAFILNMTPNLLSDHASHIYKKLEVKTRIGLVLRHCREDLGRTLIVRGLDAIKPLDK
jgi:DNA-binding CsgD family transcriptional regulator